MCNALGFENKTVEKRGGEGPAGKRLRASGLNGGNVRHRTEMRVLIQGESRAQHYVSRATESAA